LVQELQVLASILCSGIKVDDDVDEGADTISENSGTKYFQSNHHPDFARRPRIDNDVPVSDGGHRRDRPINRGEVPVRINAQISFEPIAQVTTNRRSSDFSRMHTSFPGGSSILKKALPPVQ
jgi:hypothetical protein